MLSTKIFLLKIAIMAMDRNKNALYIKIKGFWFSFKHYDVDEIISI